MEFNYSINYDDYSIKNALLWGISSKHFQKVGEGKLGARIIHVLIGIVELMPIIGQISSIFEMVIVTKLGLNSSKGNATALEFISCINPTLFTELKPLTKKKVQRFLNRGGVVNIVTEDKMREKPIAIHLNEQVITGCNSGINRSQVAAAVMQEMGISVKGVLAGGDSAMNPQADYPNFADPTDETYQSATNFKETFGFCKFDQVGSQDLPDFLENPEEVKDAKQFYQNYIDRLSETHFITFGPSGPSVLRRLLKRKGNLKGFTITHIPWGDEVAHPPEGLAKCSRESYERFANKLRACFIVSP